LRKPATTAPSTASAAGYIYRDIYTYIYHGYLLPLLSRLYQGSIMEDMSTCQGPAATRARLQKQIFVLLTNIHSRFFFLCLQIHILVFVHKRICECACACVCTCVCALVCVCVYVRECVQLCVCLRVRMRGSVAVCVHVCVYVCTYERRATADNTHSCTHTNAPLRRK